MAAHDGVMAALLAQIGFQGGEAIFEGPASIIEAFSGDQRFISELTNNFGGHYYILDAAPKSIPLGDRFKHLLKLFFKL